MMGKDKIKKAVALGFEPEKRKAPHVVATGKGGVAEKIVAVAKEHGIPIQEDPDMVEVLSKLDIDREIPIELYKAVAEVLACIYRANKGKKA